MLLRNNPPGRPPPAGRRGRTRRGVERMPDALRGSFGAPEGCPGGRGITSSMRESMNGKNGFADMRISESSETISVPVSPRSAIAPRFTP